jgi:hypothetical protein
MTREEERQLAALLFKKQASSPPGAASTFSAVPPTGGHPVQVLLFSPVRGTSRSSKQRAAQTRASAIAGILEATSATGPSGGGNWEVKANACLARLYAEPEPPSETEGVELSGLLLHGRLTQRQALDVKIYLRAHGVRTAGTAIQMRETAAQRRLHSMYWQATIEQGGTKKPAQLVDFEAHVDVRSVIAFAASTLDGAGVLRPTHTMDSDYDWSADDGSGEVGSPTLAKTIVNFVCDNGQGEDKMSLFLAGAYEGVQSVKNMPAVLWRISEALLRRKADSYENQRAVLQREDPSDPFLRSLVVGMSECKSADHVIFNHVCAGSGAGSAPIASHTVLLAGGSSRLKMRLPAQLGNEQPCGPSERGKLFFAVVSTTAAAGDWVPLIGAGSACCEKLICIESVIALGGQSLIVARAEALIFPPIAVAALEHLRCETRCVLTHLQSDLLALQQLLGMLSGGKCACPGCDANSDAINIARTSGNTRSFESQTALCAAHSSGGAQFGTAVHKSTARMPLLDPNVVGVSPLHSSLLGPLNDVYADVVEPLARFMDANHRSGKKAVNALGKAATLADAERESLSADVAAEREAVTANLRGIEKEHGASLSNHVKQLAKGTNVRPIRAIMAASSVSRCTAASDSRDCRDALTTPQRARLDWLLAGVSVAHSCSSDPVTRSTRLPSSRLRPCPLILRPCTCATVRSKFITCSWLRRGGGGAVAHQRPSQGTLRSVKACATVAACGVLRSTGGSVLRTPPSPTKYRCDQRESAPSDLAPASTPALGSHPAESHH